MGMLEAKFKAKYYGFRGHWLPEDLNPKPLLAIFKLYSLVRTIKDSTCMFWTITWLHKIGCEIKRRDESSEMTGK